MNGKLSVISLSLSNSLDNVHTLPEDKHTNCTVGRIFGWLSEFGVCVFYCII